MVIFQWKTPYFPFKNPIFKGWAENMTFYCFFKKTLRYRASSLDRQFFGGYGLADENLGASKYMAIDDFFAWFTVLTHFLAWPYNWGWPWDNDIFYFMTRSVIKP